MVWLQISLSVLFISLVVLTNSNVIYDDLKLTPKECLTNKQVVGNYTPLGRMINIGNLPAYEYDTPNNTNRNRMLIGVYDIFGLANTNMMQVADRMALQGGGFRVVVPDFYRGDHWDDNLDPDDRQEWLDRVGDWNTVVRPDLLNVLSYYTSQGVEEFSIFGMCWGGRQATNSAIELGDFFKAAAIVHPAGVANSEAVNVRIPMYLMPSSNQTDMLPFYQELRARFGDNSGHRRFADMIHGFAGARGNFSDPIIQQNVNEVITTLGAFFARLM